MGAPFRIRLATAEDFAEMGEVFRRSIRSLASHAYALDQIAIWSSHPDDAALWAERMRSRVNYLAICENRIGGFVQYEPPDHVDMTYTDPDFSRMGIASALLKTLEAEALRRGVAELRVEASIVAKPFFERRGYELLTPQIVRVRGTEFLNYRMRKRLMVPI